MQSISWLDVWLFISHVYLLVAFGGVVWFVIDVYRKGYKIDQSKESLK